MGVFFCCYFDTCLCVDFHHIYFCKICMSTVVSIIFLRARTQQLTLMGGNKYFLLDEWAMISDASFFFHSIFFCPHTDNPFIPRHCFSGRLDTCLQLVNYQIHSPYRCVYDTQTFRDNENLSGYIGALAPHVAIYPAV